MPGPTGYHALLDALRDGALPQPEAFLIALRAEYDLAHVLYGDLRWDGSGFVPGTLLHGHDPQLEDVIRHEGIAIFSPLFRAAAGRFGPGVLDPADLDRASPGTMRLRIIFDHRRPLLLFPLLPSRPGVAFLACDPVTSDNAEAANEVLLRDLAALAGLFHASQIAGSRVRLQSSDRKQVQIPRLTPREREVLYWVAAGKTYWEIARILGISERTVRHFMAACREKLDAVSNKQAVAKAVAGGLIAVGDARAAAPA